MTTSTGRSRQQRKMKRRQDDDGDTSDETNVSTESSRSKWEPEQEAMWRQILESSAPGEKFRDLVARLNDESAINGWQRRSMAACRLKRQRLCGTDTSYKDLKWTYEQRVELIRIHSDTSLTWRQVTDEFNAIGRTRGWPERSFYTIVQQWRRMDDQSETTNTTFSLDVQATVDDVTMANVVCSTPRPVSVPVDRRWSKEEDELLMRFIRHGYYELRQDTRKFNEEMRRRHVNYIPRSFVSVHSRLQRLKKRAVDAATRPNYARVWSQDEELFKMMTEQPSEQERLRMAARRMGISLNFLRLRWEALKARRGLPVLTRTVEEALEDEEEARQLRSQPPDGWNDRDTTQSPYLSTRECDDDEDQVSDMEELSTPVVNRRSERFLQRSTESVNSMREQVESAIVNEERRLPTGEENVTLAIVRDECRASVMQHTSDDDDAASDITMNLDDIEDDALTSDQAAQILEQANVEMAQLDGIERCDDSLVSHMRTTSPETNMDGDDRDSEVFIDSALPVMEEEASNSIDTARVWQESSMPEVAKPRESDNDPCDIACGACKDEQSEASGEHNRSQKLLSEGRGASQALAHEVKASTQDELIASHADVGFDVPTTEFESTDEVPVTAFGGDEDDGKAREVIDVVGSNDESDEGRTADEPIISNERLATPAPSEHADDDEETKEELQVAPRPLLPMKTSGDHWNWQILRNLDRKQLPDASPLRLLYTTCAQAYNNIGKQTIIVNGPRRLLPRLTTMRGRELLFISALVASDKDVQALFLWEMWKRDDMSSYGPCRDDACCLKYDFMVNNYRHDGPCRHWLMFSTFQVYMDGFRSVEDYRLAAALSCQLESWYAIRPDSPSRRPVEQDMITMPIAAKGLAVQCFTRWDDDRHSLNVKMAACVLVGIVVDKDQAMVVQTTQQQQDDEQNYQRHAELHPFDYGTIQFAVDATSDRVYPAVLINFDGWMFLAKVPISRLATARTIYWRPALSIQNYVRRFTTVEYCQPFPLMRSIATRDCGLEVRTDEERGRLHDTQAWRNYCIALDKHQLQAFKQVTEMKGITLLRGPFGCGKTRTIAAMVAGLMEAYPNEVIAVTSETNAAIDEDLRRLVDEKKVDTSKILRLGEVSQQMAKYKEYYLSYHLQKFREEQNQGLMTKREAHDARMVFEKKRLSEARVFVATLSVLGRESYSNLRINIVINDEGAQTPEVAALQALRKETHSLVPIGDTLQLLGFTNLPEDRAECFASGLRRHKLIWSLLHSIPYGQTLFPGVTVRSQYRCHPEIGAVLSVFYEYPLDHLGIPSPCYLSRMKLTKAQVNGIDRRMCFISCNQSHEGQQELARGLRDISRSNIVERWMTIEILLRAARELRYGSCGVERVKVLVITPYLEQVKRFRHDFETITRRWISRLDVEVTTIDSCQGREANIAIVSFVRADGTLGFLEGADRRLLVSVSRGKDYLFVLAHKPTFEQDPMWRRLYEAAAQQNALMVNVAMNALEANDAINDWRYQERLCSVAR